MEILHSIVDPTVETSRRGDVFLGCCWLAYLITLTVIADFIHSLGSFPSLYSVVVFTNVDGSAIHIACFPPGAQLCSPGAQLC